MFRAKLNYLPLRSFASHHPAVFYLMDNFPNRPPTRDGFAHGGKVKTVYLAERFPHTFPFANILYTVSSVGNPFAPQIVLAAKKRKLKIVVNQNGVAYPAWHGPGWEDTNQWLKATIDHADFIIYQSRFCQASAERFLSPPNVPFDVVYNPVDTELFIPSQKSGKPKSLTLILGGNHNQRYRVELAIQTLKAVTKFDANAKLIITGRLWKPEDDAMEWTKNLLRVLDLRENVVFTGHYSQQQAPGILNQAHLLLHTQYNDASPTIVLEAMATGLPIVYIDSGGVPELVADAGIGVPVEQSWERINLPDPHDMGQAVLQIMSRYQEFSDVARERAVRLFALEIFISKHRQIFEQLLGN